MSTMIRGIPIFLGLAMLAGPARAGGHHKSAAASDTYPLACHVWMPTKVTETVYDVTYKVEKKKVRRPIIKEVRQPVSCSVCKPVDSTVLEPRKVDDYYREFGVAKGTVEDPNHCDVACDANGRHAGICPTPKTATANPTSCILKTKTDMQVPVLKWEGVPSEDVHDMVYYVREWVDEEVEVRTPVKTPRQITRTVWRKVPYCPPEKGCANGSCGADLASAGDSAATAPSTHAQFTAGAPMGTSDPPAVVAARIVRTPSSEPATAPTAGRGRSRAPNRSLADALSNLRR